MSSRVFAVSFHVLALLVVSALCAQSDRTPAAPPGSSPAFATTAATPSLAVVISVDQFRADLVQRFRAHYAEGGLARFLREGADYRETRYTHAVAKTAPGHATILTGVPAAVHGVFANDWFDVASGKSMPAVFDPDAPLVGLENAARSPGGVVERDAGRSPRNLQTTTVGDQLKLRYGERTRVIAVAGKDRAAILLGGHLADGAFWIENGRFVTSRYYAAALPAWVQAFNTAHNADAAFGSTWDRLLPAAIYDAVQGPDDAPGETKISYGYGPTFPKKIDGGRPQISPDFYEAFDVSPLAIDFVTDLAIAAIRAEKLGRRSAPDLLAISYSQPDLAGHLYGPDSHELMDSILRLDRSLETLFTALDRDVGAGRWIAVLTADHGAAPLPELVTATSAGRIPAGRLDTKRLDQDVKTALDAAFGPPANGAAWVRRDQNGYRFIADTLAERKVRVEDAAIILRDALRKAPEVADSWTRAEILALPFAGEGIPGAIRRGYYPPLGQDVLYVIKPYFIERSRAGTTHGMPYDYDLHVPQLWLGAGVKHGVHVERASVEDIAPTLAAQLGVPAPPQSVGRRLF